MKKLLKYFNLKIGLSIELFAIFCCISIQLNAFELIEDSDSIDVWSLTVDENIKYPVVPNEVTNIVQCNIKKQYINLKKLGYNISLVRNNEAIMITIPIDNLFDSNTYNEISYQAKSYLEPILPFFRIKEMYRVVFLLHHDNSLCSKDADYITNERVLTLSEWFVSKCSNAKSLIPYSMGADFPIAAESTHKVNERNRRLEIFILPGQTMIDLAKDNKLCNFVEK